MKAILCLVLLAGASVAVADSGSGSGAPAAGSGSADGSGSAGSGSAASIPAPAPAPPSGPDAAAREACGKAMEGDEQFAQKIILVAENKLHEKMNSEQVLKDLCVLRDHSDSQADVATNKKHVLMAYIAMWLVAAGFLIFMWRKQQGLKLEIANLRRDLDAATKDDK